MRCTDACERKVAAHTARAESSHALVSGGPDLGNKSKAALGTHGTLSHISITGIGASHRYAGLLLTFWSSMPAV